MLGSTWYFDDLPYRLGGQRKGKAWPEFQGFDVLTFYDLRVRRVTNPPPFMLKSHLRNV